MNFKETPYGFQYGPAKIERMTSDEKAGWICLMLDTEKTGVQIMVSKTGNITVYLTRGRKVTVKDRR
jgi:hypothetical protein